MTKGRRGERDGGMQTCLILLSLLKMEQHFPKSKVDILVGYMGTSRRKNFSSSRSFSLSILWGQKMSLFAPPPPIALPLSRLFPPLLMAHFKGGSSLLLSGDKGKGALETFLSHSLPFPA